MSADTSSRIAQLLRVVVVVFVAGGTVWAGSNSPEDQQGLSTSETRRITAANIAVLEFKPPDNIRGEMRIRTDVDAEDIEIGIRKNVSNILDGERAAKILESITVKTETSRDLLRIGLQTPQNPEWEGSRIGVAVVFEILLPPGRTFRGDSELYDFDLRGPFREVQIYGTYGGIQVAGVTETANLRAEYGALTLADAQGRIELNNQYGTTTAQNLTGLSTPLKVRSERGDIKMEAVAGAVDIQVDDGLVTISGWTATGRDSRIISRNSPVTVDLIGGEKPNVMIRTVDGDVTVTTHEDFSARVQSSINKFGGGYIRTRGLPLKVTQIDRHALEGVAGDGDGLLDITIENHGSIMLRGPKPVVREDENGSI